MAALYPLYKRNLSAGMAPHAAMQSALAEQARILSGQPSEEASGTRKVRKQRRKEANDAAQRRPFSEDH